MSKISVPGGIVAADRQCLDFEKRHQIQLFRMPMLALSQGPNSVRCLSVDKLTISILPVLQVAFSIDV